MELLLIETLNTARLGDKCSLMPSTTVGADASPTAIKKVETVKKLLFNILNITFHVPNYTQFWKNKNIFYFLFFEYSLFIIFEIFVLSDMMFALYFKVSTEQRVSTLFRPYSILHTFQYTFQQSFSIVIRSAVEYLRLILITLYLVIVGALYPWPPHTPLIISDPQPRLTSQVPTDWSSDH